MGNWLLVTNMFQGLSLLDFLRDWVTCSLLNFSNRKVTISCWSSPSIGSLKLNFDGSSMGNPWLSGFGCVIRDSTVEIVRIVAGLVGFADSTKAEVMGLLMGLREIRDLKLKVALVEGDSSVVVGWGLGLSEGSWKYAQQIHEIRDLVAALKVDLKHVPRSQNGGVVQPTIIKSNVIHL